MDFAPYLNFDGNCADAFRFYQGVFGGRIEMMQAFGDSPAAGDVPPDWRDKILHAALVVDGRWIMGSDAPPGTYKPAEGLWVSISVDSAGEGRKLFDALADGGRVVMPYAGTFWSPGFGMVVDRFGTPWMINSQGA